MNVGGKYVNAADMKDVMSNPRQLPGTGRSRRHVLMHSVWRSIGPLGTAALLTVGLLVGASGVLAPVTASSYATSLLKGAPTPSGAAPVNHLPQKLESAFGSGRTRDAVEEHRYFVLAKGINLLNFLHAHLPQGYAVGTGLSNDTAGMYGTGYELTPTCTDRHVASCELDYTIGTFDDGVNELRIDALVVWVPVHVAQLPTSGVVTLTAYGRLSLINPPSDPVTVALGHTQVKRLSAVLGALRNDPGGQICAEGTVIYRLDVAPSSGAHDTWSAIDDSCGGELTVVRQSGSPEFELNGTSCSVQRLVMSFLAPGEATASKELLKTCSN